MKNRCYHGRHIVYEKLMTILQITPKFDYFVREKNNLHE